MDQGRDLRGRTALVTGAARRIGRELALALGGRGAAVALHYGASAAEAEETAAALAELGARTALVPGDLADPGTPARVAAAAAEALGPVDILVNNAAVFEPGDVSGTDAEVWDRHLAINLRAPFLLARAVAVAAPAGRGGDVVNLNDWRGLRPCAEYFAYTQSKAGLHALTRNLALALAPDWRVNEIALGAVLPPPGAPEGYEHMLREEIPTRRFPRPAEVADALLFLLGNAAVTGQTVCVDGGRHLV